MDPAQELEPLYVHLVQEPLYAHPAQEHSSSIKYRPTSDAEFSSAQGTGLTPQQFEPGFVKAENKGPDDHAGNQSSQWVERFHLAGLTNFTGVATSAAVQ